MGKFDHSLKLDSQLGPFRIVRVIGVGGMGEVYEAIDNTLHRRVALKIISPNFEGDESILRRFQTEGKALAQINHKNIVTVYSLGFENGMYCMVMELLDGRSLGEIIDGAPLSSKTVLSLLKQILEGVSVLHAAGI